MDKTERWEYHRFMETASDRQLAKERIELEFLLETLPASSEQVPNVRWMHRVLQEEISARAEVRAYLEKRLRR